MDSSSYFATSSSIGPSSMPDDSVSTADQHVDALTDPVMVTEAQELEEIQSSKCFGDIIRRYELRRRKIEGDKFKKRESVGSEPLPSASISIRSAFTSKLIQSIESDKNGWHKPIKLILRNPGYSFPRVLMHRGPKRSYVQLEPFPIRFLLVPILAALVHKDYSDEVKSQFLSSLRRDGFNVTLQFHQSNIFSQLLFQFRNCSQEGLFAEVMEILFAQPSCTGKALEATKLSCFHNQEYYTKLVLPGNLPRGYYRCTSQRILADYYVALMERTTNCSIDADLLYKWIGDPLPEILISVLARLSPRSLRRIDLRTVLDQTQAVMNPENLTCAARHIIYASVHRLHEWQIRQEGDSSASSASVSVDDESVGVGSFKLLPELPSARDDFSSWIRELHSQLPDRLSAYHSVDRLRGIHGDATMMEMIVRQLTSQNGSLLNLFQPRFLQYLFASRTETLQRLLPVRSILLHRIEQMEIDAPGTLAPMLAHMSAVPSIMDPDDMVSPLYRLTMQLQSPPDPTLWVHFRTDRFLASYVYVVSRAWFRAGSPGELEALERMIEMVRSVDEPGNPSSLESVVLPTVSSDNSSTSSATVIDDLHGSITTVDSWNRRTLLPGVSYRSFLLFIESMILFTEFEGSDKLRNWWFSRTWCRDEVCWPLEVLQREHVRISKTPGALVCYHEAEEIMFNIEKEKWNEIISPIIQVFQDSTTIHTDIVRHEILPFLRASSEHRDADVSN